MHSKQKEYNRQVTGERERDVLFNNAHNTFYLQLWRRTYGKGPLKRTLAVNR